MKARDLRIGDRFGGTPANPGRIKNLHEMCPQYDGPHVHVVHTGGSTCLPFGREVSS